MENNLWGLDIDERAAQLAYFAVMMKARQYDRRFFTRKVQPHVYAIEESNGITSAPMHDMGLNLSQEEYGEAVKQAMRLVEEMHDAKEYGSIIHVTPCDWNLLRRFAIPREEEGQLHLDIHGEMEASVRLQVLINIGETLAQKYDVVVTNPPYMGNMPVKMTSLVQKLYPDSKYDLYAVFVEKNSTMLKKHGLLSMITQHSWMFISSFERFRNHLMQKDYVQILHLGTRAFEEIGGEVVQTVSFVLRNSKTLGNSVVACRLVDYGDADSKERAFLGKQDLSYIRQSNFGLMPGGQVVYWLNNGYFDALQKNCYIDQFVERKAGVVTGNDNYFLRLWFEPSINDVSFVGRPAGEYKKYHVMSKGGSARRFYGNYEYLIKLNDLYDSNKTNVSVRRGDQDYYFRKAIGWSQVGNAQKTFRVVENAVCGTATPTIYFRDNRYFNYVLGFLNTKVAFEYLAAYNPTINLLTTDICNLPLLIDEECLTKVDRIVEQCIKICEDEWDSYETSWNFREHPFIAFVHSAFKLDEAITIREAFEDWKRVAEGRFQILKENEEELNRIFIGLYGLENELDPTIKEEGITIRRADLQRDVRSFISYAVGCMFGRYTLDRQGLIYAGGQWDDSRYSIFQPDRDAIIPICDDEYFEDDIVGRLVKFVEVVYGKETLEDNLRFIADALGGKGSSRKVIRNYFINDFYKDHLKVYQKRPIYWLFDSGKKNGFKCLIYMHRYQPDTIARIRTDYVHEQQSRYRTAIADLEQRINGTSTSERVKLSKQLSRLQAQAEEIRVYEEKIHHLADQMIKIDLDDGVKHNYAIFKDVLAKIK